MALWRLLVLEGRRRSLYIPGSDCNPRSATGEIAVPQPMPPAEEQAQIQELAEALCDELEAIKLRAQLLGAAVEPAAPVPCAAVREDA